MENDDIYTKWPCKKKSGSISDGKNLIEIAVSQNDENKSALSNKMYDNCASVNSGVKSKSYTQSDNYFSSSTSKLEDIKGILFCYKCKNPYIIIFMDNLDLSFDCGCNFLKNLTIEEYINEYKNKVKNEQYFVHCRKHKNETKLIYYCLDCDYDICELCLKEDSYAYSNKKIKYKAHENHGLVVLDDINEKFENIKKSIEICNKLIEDKNYDKNKKNKVINIIFVIKTLIEYYPHYKCSNFYKGLINAENILEKIKANYNFGGHENLVDFRKITTENNLSQIKDFTDIKSISIKNSKLVIDLSIFSNRNFQYLTELILINDQISDISPLFSCEFPALEKLDLENNNIDNTIIQFLKTKKFPELTFLNLFMNKITSLEIFEVIKTFKNLTTFYIGENKLDIHNNTKDYELPEKLEILGITGNFDGEDANFIEKLKIENLKVLYLSRNNISSLKYLKKFKFKRLEKIWAITNEITDIKEIMNINSKENLKIINLKQNKINNFKELFNIIGDFPILEKIVLIDNNISEKEVIEMKKRIKEKYKRDLNIEVTKLFYNIYKI